MKKTPLRKQSKQPIPTLKRKTDRVVQDYFRSLELKCEVCGKRADIVHHFIEKSRSSNLRYNEINLVPLCHQCHSKHHQFHDSMIHAKIIIKRGVKWFKKLEKLKGVYKDINSRKFLESIKEYYEDKLKDKPSPKEKE